MYVLGIKPRVSRRVASPLRCLTVSPAPRQIFINREEACTSSWLHSRLSTSAGTGNLNPMRSRKGLWEINCERTLCICRKQRTEFTQDTQLWGGWRWPGWLATDSHSSVLRNRVSPQNQSCSTGYFPWKMSKTFSQAVNMLCFHERTADVLSKDMETLCPPMHREQMSISRHLLGMVVHSGLRRLSLNPRVQGQSRLQGETLSGQKKQIIRKRKN